MDLRTVAAVTLGIAVGIGVCVAASRAVPKRAAGPGEGGAQAPSAAGDRPSAVSKREILYLRFPDCPGCARNLRWMEAALGEAGSWSVLDVLAEENEALAEKYFRGAATHGALARTQGKVVWSAPCQTVTKEGLREALAAPR